MELNKIVGVRWNDRRPDPKQQGRVCQSEGCNTMLSQYNAGSFCAACDRAEVRPPKTRRRLPPPSDDLLRRPGEIADDERSNS